MPPGSWLSHPTAGRGAWPPPHPTPVVLMSSTWISALMDALVCGCMAPEGPGSPATLLPWFYFLSPLNASLVPSSTPPTSIPAFTSTSSSLASHLPFLSRELCGVLTFPQWHLKCFLVQNILFIAIETGSSVWKERGEKKEVWESEALQFCYFAQIHKWQHTGR